MTFAERLRRHGDRLCVVTPDGVRFSYAEIADRVVEVSARLGPERRLVLISATNDLESLVTYLAALHGGHPVLLAPDDSLVPAYDPDVVLHKGKLVQRRKGTAHRLHPELAVLLSTSGSTGSPKLVRLSAGNIRANASAIARYLDIRPTDRAMVSLPMHYCYGLSVINSNLSRGAALVLTNDSVIDPGFWDTFRRHECTSLHGVPYTFELLDSLGLDWWNLPSLRYVTQAGGRLDPERVRRYASLTRLFVMYGQTEATARMAYLPPSLAASRPDTIGIPIPGGSFDLADDGELIYRGPNVMLGYAQRPADLALGRTVAELSTGDIARLGADGLYEIVGRKNRFAKVFGLRIDLQRVEQDLERAGYAAACAGSDDELVVAVAGEAAPDRVRCGLPADRIRIVPVPELPRLPNGKVDYPAIARLGAQAGTRSTAGRHPVRQAFARVLRLREVPGDATFVSLGGDSLSYVRMSMELNKILGRLPEGWPSLPVRQLERLRRRTGLLRALETNIALRALAIALIVGTHVGLFAIYGGAHLLLVVAGYSFARFGLSHVDNRVARRILLSGARIAIPAMLWLTFRAAVTPDVTITNILLINNYLTLGTAGYWFIEALVQILLLLAIVFAIPAVRRLEHRHGFAVALAALLLSLLGQVPDQPASAFNERDMSTHSVLWFFVLGWLAHRALTPLQKSIVVIAALLIVPGHFEDPVREGIVAGGLVLLLFVPRLLVPRPVAGLTGLVAGASLYLYLTHYAVFPSLVGVPPLLTVLVCLAVGVAVELCDRLLRRIAHDRRRDPPTPLVLRDPRSVTARSAAAVP